MTIKRLCSALALTLICTVSTLYPYIYKGMIWRNKKANGEFQYVFGAADYHVANKRVTRAQKSRVSSAFRSYILKKQKIKAIVEDIDSYDGKDASVKAFDEIQNKNKKKGVSDSFLGGLYQKLKKMNIPVCNVECRHAKTLMCDLLEIGIADDISLENIPAICALGQQAAQKLGLEFKELSKHQIINAICQAYNIKIRNITDELKCCMHQLKSYKDSKVLNSCYKSIGHSIMAEGKKIISAGLHLSDLGKTPWACLQKRIPKEKQQGIIDLIRNFNAPVLDIKALHEIYTVQDADRIFLFMGGQHIKAIGEILEKMGYEKIYDSGTKRLVSKTQEKKWYQISGPDRIKGEGLLDSTPVYAGVERKFFRLFTAKDPSQGFTSMSLWEKLIELFSRIIDWIMSFFN